MAFSVENDLSRKIKAYALSVGFDLIGITASKELEFHKKILKRWLSSAMHAQLGFLSHKIEERTNPALLSFHSISEEPTSMNKQGLLIKGP